MNQVQLIGNVGNDPEIINTSGGKRAIKFTVATTEKFNDQEITIWHNVVGWGWIADKPIQKGNRVYVSGKISNRSYEANDGTKKYISEVVASFVDIFQRTQNVSRPDELKTPAQEKFDEHSDITPKNDLPF